jgi:hypothetical protein
MFMIFSSECLKVCFKLSLSALLFCMIPQVQAGASNKNGNPYGNGTFFSDSGTFSAVERSSNGFLGVIQFATRTANTSTNSLTNSGIATIFAEGQQFVGSAFGTVNGSQIAATYSGFFGVTILLPTSVLGTNGEIQSTTYQSQDLTNSCSGQFTGTLQNSYPTQFFNGQGQSTVLLNTVVEGTNANGTRNPNDITVSTTSKNYTTSVSGSRWTQ